MLIEAIRFGNLEGLGVVYVDRYGWYDPESQSKKRETLHEEWGS